MTLIASMRDKYGAIILADSQETVKDRDGNEFKYAVLKSVPESVKGFRYVIAGGGDGDAIDELTAEFKRSLQKSSCRSLESFRVLLERQLDREIRYLKTIKAVDARLEIVVAAAKSKKWEVWRNANKTLIPTIKDHPTLVGFDAEVYKHVGRELYPHAKNTAQIILAGLRVLELARQSSTCVGSPYSGIAVTPGGLFTIDSNVLAELTESITSFGTCFDRLLLACADTSVRGDTFSGMVDEFKTNILHLRNDYLQSVAEKDFMAGLSGAGCGIQLLPDNSMRTATLGGGKFSVKVEELKPKA